MNVIRAGKKTGDAGSARHNASHLLAVRKPCCGERPEERGLINGLLGNLRGDGRWWNDMRHYQNQPRAASDNASYRSERQSNRKLYQLKMEAS
jgi:hypothetical protein